MPNTLNMFKESFKFYKRINSIDQQSDVIDFEHVTNSIFIVSI